MNETLTKTKPKLGFAGVGWIGRNRMKAINDSRIADITAAADPVKTSLSSLDGSIQELQICRSYSDLFDYELDGVVIASPSALHAEQAIDALKRGMAVFCQKPLGTNLRETEEVIETARNNDLLLEVDFSYRHTLALKKVKEAVKSGRLGNIYAVDLTFHNAYGPDKSWYRNKKLSGGGCLMDLGIHLIDMVFWILDDPHVIDLKCNLFQQGKPFKNNGDEVEDYATAQLTLENDTAVQLSCSWNLPAGKDAIIEATFYGERGGVSFRNTDGSFFDFIAEEYTNTSTIILAEPPDDWSGRAAVQWTEKLAEANRFNPEAEIYADVAHTIDLLYKSCFHEKL